jgi:hypothetical protein
MSTKGDELSDDAKMARFFSEAKAIFAYDPLLLACANALEQIVSSDPKPYEGLVAKLSEKTGQSRARISNFIKMLRFRGHELTDSPLNKKPAMPNTFPLDAISELLAMVRGTTPFALIPAIKDTLAIAEYGIGIFDAKTLPMSDTPDFSLEDALVLVRAQHTDKHVKALNTSVWQYLVQLILQWLAQKSAIGQS